MTEVVKCCLEVQSDKGLFTYCDFCMLKLIISLFKWKCMQTGSDAHAVGCARFLQAHLQHIELKTS